MLVERANMFLCRNSFKTIQDIVERLVPQCPVCFCKMRYFCVDECCIHSQPVCYNCSKEQTHKHFMHNLNRVELLHLDKDYLPRQVDAFRKKHEEVKELVESNRIAYLEVIEEYTHYVRELEQYMDGLEDNLERSIKSTQVFISLDRILEHVLDNSAKMTHNTRNEYWKLLESMKLKEVKYDLLPDKYTVLSINRIRRQIQLIIQKYTSLTFEEILKKNHMGFVFDYDEINKYFITNVFGNLEDRTLRTYDQELDPQIVKNLNKLIIQQTGYFQQDDLPHSIKQLEYLNFDCSQPAVFPQKIQSLVLSIHFNSYTTLRFNNHHLPSLQKLIIKKQPHCLNTSIDYQQMQAFKALKHLQVYDEGVTQQTRQMLIKFGISNKMRVLRIGPDNSHNLQKNYFRQQKALLFAHKFYRCSLQYLNSEQRTSLLQRILSQ